MTATYKHPMESAHGNLEKRRPVWEALFDLFLQTDTSLSRTWRVGILAASPHSIDDLQQILVEERHPLCRLNLFSIAGERAGFTQSGFRIGPSPPLLTVSSLSSVQPCIIGWSLANHLRSDLVIDALQPGRVARSNINPV